MAFVIHRPGLEQSVKAATTILPRQAVSLVGTNALLVAPVATSNVEPFAYNGEATCLVGEQVTIYEDQNIVKAVAAASVGVGAKVTTASTNGALGPAVVVASGHFEHGLTESAAAAGEVFSLYVRIRKAA